MRHGFPDSLHVVRPHPLRDVAPRCGRGDARRVATWEAAAVRILATSDWHGMIPMRPSGKWDVVVHCGDMKPNRTRGTRVIEEPFQRQWIRQNAGKIARYCDGRPLVYVPGNHDYWDPAESLSKVGVVCHTLIGTSVEIDGVRFLGFPWVPSFTGEWNREEDEQDIYNRLDEIDIGANDVLISHGPPRGHVDVNAWGEMCGSLALEEKLRSLRRHRLSFVLCGHIHECAGNASMLNGIGIYNVATTMKLVEFVQKSPH